MAKGAIVGGVIGFVLGAGLMYLYMKKTDQPAEETVYVPKSERKEAGDKPEKPPVRQDVSNDPAADYINALRNKGSYSQKYNDSVEIKKDEIDISSKPDFEILDPEEDAVGEIPGYNFFTLKYYADGYLIDEGGDLVENPDHVVGKDFMNHFGEYEEDTVYVRNNILEADFMIIRLDTNYEI